MSDRVKLAREIAARTKPRFIEPIPSRWTAKCWRIIAARSKPRFVTIERERPGRVHFTEDELQAIRTGLSAEKHRRPIVHRRRHNADDRVRQRKRKTSVKQHDGAGLVCRWAGGGALMRPSSPTPRRLSTCQHP